MTTILPSKNEQQQHHQQREPFQTITTSGSVNLNDNDVEGEIQKCKEIIQQKQEEMNMYRKKMKKKKLMVEKKESRSITPTSSTDSSNSSNQEKNENTIHTTPKFLSRIETMKSIRNKYNKIQEFYAKPLDIGSFVGTERYVTSKDSITLKPVIITPKNVALKGYTYVVNEEDKIEKLQKKLMKKAKNNDKQQQQPLLLSQDIHQLANKEDHAFRLYHVRSHKWDGSLFTISVNRESNMKLIVHVQIGIPEKTWIYKTKKVFKGQKPVCTTCTTMESSSSPSSDVVVNLFNKITQNEKEQKQQQRKKNVQKNKNSDIGEREISKLYLVACITNRNGNESVLSVVEGYDNDNDDKEDGGGDAQAHDEAATKQQYKWKKLMKGIRFDAKRRNAKAANIASNTHNGFKAYVEDYVHGSLIGKVYNNGQYKIIPGGNTYHIASGVDMIYTLLVSNAVSPDGGKIGSLLF